MIPVLLSELLSKVSGLRVAALRSILVSCGSCMVQWRRRSPLFISGRDDTTLPASDASHRVQLFVVISLDMSANIVDTICMYYIRLHSITILIKIAHSHGILELSTRRRLMWQYERCDRVEHALPSEYSSFRNINILAWLLYHTIMQ